MAGVGSAKCQRLRNKVKTNFNMGASNLSTADVVEAVWADRDDSSSQKSEELDETESIGGESEEDVLNEKIELCHLILWIFVM